MDPGREVEALVDPIEGSEDPEEGFSCQVFSQQGIAHQAIGQATDRMVVTEEELIESLNATALKGPDELNVPRLRQRLRRLRQFAPSSWNSAVSVTKAFSLR